VGLCIQARFVLALSCTRNPSFFLSFSRTFVHVGMIFFSPRNMLFWGSLIGVIFSLTGVRFSLTGSDIQSNWSDNQFNWK